MSKSKYTEEFKKEVGEATFEEGMSLAKVGEKFNVHPTLVRNWRIKYCSDRLSADETQEIDEKFEEENVDADFMKMLEDEVEQDNQNDSDELSPYDSIEKYMGDEEKNFIDHRHPKTITACKNDEALEKKFNKLIVHLVPDEFWHNFPTRNLVYDITKYISENKPADFFESESYKVFLKEDDEIAGKLKNEEFEDIKDDLWEISSSEDWKWGPTLRHYIPSIADDSLSGSELSKLIDQANDAHKTVKNIVDAEDFGGSYQDNSIVVTNTEKLQNSLYKIFNKLDNTSWISSQEEDEGQDLDDF